MTGVKVASRRLVLARCFLRAFFCTGLSVKIPGCRPMRWCASDVARFLRCEFLRCSAPGPDTHRSIL